MFCSIYLKVLILKHTNFSDFICVPDLKVKLFYNVCLLVFIKKKTLMLKVGSLVLLNKC